MEAWGNWYGLYFSGCTEEGQSPLINIINIIHPLTAVSQLEI